MTEVPSEKCERTIVLQVSRHCWEKAVRAVSVPLSPLSCTVVTEDPKPCEERPICKASAVPLSSDMVHSRDVPWP